MAVIFAPPNTMPHIGSIWAYLSVDENGNEGVCACPLWDGGPPIPMIAADKARLESLSKTAEMLAKATGMRIRLVEFTTRNDLREIGRATS